MSQLPECPICQQVNCICRRPNPPFAQLLAYYFQRTKPVHSLPEKGILQRPTMNQLKELQQRIGRNCQILRDRNGMSKEQAAVLLEISGNELNKLEAGSLLIKTSLLLAISNTYGISITGLINMDLSES